MTSRLRALLVLLLLAFVAWTYRDALDFGFLPLADDDANIFVNPHLSAPGGSALWWMFTDVGYVHRYMPLGWLGFSVTYAGSALDPAGYHAANILFHGLCACLLFGVVVRLLARFEPRASQVDRLLAAGSAALLWAVHPLRVESVATCSGMLYSQALFIALLAVHARLSELEARLRGTPSLGWLILGFAAYAASVLTYPVALFLPPALLILDLAWTRPRHRWGVVPGCVLWSGVAGACVFLNIEARYTVTSDLLPPSLRTFGIIPRALQALYMYANYVGKSLWPPSVLRMADTIVFEVDPARLFWWLCAGLVAGLCLISWLLRKQAAFFGLSWLAYMVLLVPNLGLMENPHTAGDRYSYLPACTFAIILAFALVRVAPALRPWAWATALAAAFACSVLATRQAPVWRNASSYFAAELAGTKRDDIRAITHSRIAYLRFLGGDVRGGREAARAELEVAPDTAGVVSTWVQMKPASTLSSEVQARRLQEWTAAPWSMIQREVAREQTKQGRLTDALAHLDAALALSPDYSDARFARGLLLADLGRLEARHDWLIYRASGQASDRTRGPYLAARLAAVYLEHGLPVPRALAQAEAGAPKN